MWGDDRRLTAIGAMRLSTSSARDENRAVATLQAAFDAGLTVVDTANAYALDETDVGHNERLIARALATWNGERERITVLTKGGLTRPAGRWVPDGRARHLRAACEASRTALGVERIALYQLHAPDPRVSWATSIRALDALLRAQAIDAIGLCNVTVPQIEEARAITAIATVQVELSPWKDRAVAGGVVDYCRAHGIRLLAYRPFGGEQGSARLRRDGLLQEIAIQRSVSPVAVVLTWMRGLAPHIVPLPGPTRPESARECVHAQQITLSDGELTELDRHFPIGRIRTPAPLPVRRMSHAAGGDRASQDATASDIVMVMGLPGAGKSTVASELVTRGYHRLNRDEAGGSLAGLLPQLQALLNDGIDRIVLDNTYLSRASRAPVIELASSHGRSVRGVWLAASVEDAQVNIVERMLGVHHRLLTSDELKAGGSPDRLSPTALFRAQREMEQPGEGEGFHTIDVMPFVRRFDPARQHRAVIVWCDGVLRSKRAGGDAGVEIDDEALTVRRSVLARYEANGFRLFALSWEPRITEEGVAIAEVESEFSQLRARLGVGIEFHYCPHGSGPPVCWCRKPLPGLGVWLAHRYHLDVRQCVYVGATPHDPPFARRLGFQYCHADDFFR